MAMLVKFGKCWFDLVMSVFYLHFFFIGLCCCAYGGHFSYRQRYHYPFISLIFAVTFISSYFVCLNFWPLVVCFLVYICVLFNLKTLQLCNVEHLNQKKTPNCGCFFFFITI